MRPVIVCGLAAWLVNSWAVAAPKLKDPPKKETPLVGEWVSESDNGRVRFLFTADGRLTIQIAPNTTVRYTYTVDAKATPAQLDAVQEDSTDRRPFPGVYRIDGDLLIVRFNAPGSDRPAVLDGPEAGLSMYKRRKPKD